MQGDSKDRLDAQLPTAGGLQLQQQQQRRRTEARQTRGGHDGVARGCSHRCYHRTFPVMTWHGMAWQVSRERGRECVRGVRGWPPTRWPASGVWRLAFGVCGVRAVVQAAGVA